MVGLENSGLPEEVVGLECVEMVLWDVVDLESLVMV